MIGQPPSDFHLAPCAYIADHQKERIFIGESSCCTSALVVRVRHCPLTGWQPFEAVSHIDVAGHQVPVRYCRTQQRSESHYGQGTNSHGLSRFSTEFNRDSGTLPAMTDTPVGSTRIIVSETLQHRISHEIRAGALSSLRVDGSSEPSLSRSLCIALSAMWRSDKEALCLSSEYA